MMNVYDRDGETQFTDWHKSLNNQPPALGAIRIAYGPQQSLDRRFMLVIAGCDLVRSDWCAVTNDYEAVLQRYERLEDWQDRFPAWVVSGYPEEDVKQGGLMWLRTEGPHHSTWKPKNSEPENG